MVGTSHSNQCRKMTCPLAARVSRKGKHHLVVAQLIKDLAELKDGRALKIPFTDLPDTKANIRSALSRAAKQSGLTVLTSSDNLYLYIWNQPRSKGKAEDK